MKIYILLNMMALSLTGNLCQDIDVDALINQVFDTNIPTTSTTSSYDKVTERSEKTNGNDECNCVPYYQCSTNNTFIENGEGLIDIRLKIDSCDDYLDVCCGTNATVLKPVDPSPKPQTYTCGQRNLQGVSSLRITGDLNNEAQFGEFPWMVAVTGRQQAEGSNIPVSVYQCGGSIINPSVVLTAAHCVYNKTGLNVRAGEWDTQTKSEPLPMQVTAVKDVFVHEEYNPRTLHNDVALLLLETPLELAEHIGTICLPEQDENMDGRQCVASGWGKDVFGREGRYQVILKKVELPTVARSPCLEALQKTRLGVHFKLHETFICAGGIKGKDTCQGDGGSPLACPSSTDSRVYVQAGIVAWGIGCNSETPGVYVNVARFRNWIDNKMAELIDPRQY